MVPGAWVDEEPKCPRTSNGEHRWEDFDSNGNSAQCFECDCKKMPMYRVPEP